MTKVIDYKKILKETNTEPKLFQIMDENGKIVNKDYFPELTDEQMVEMMEVMVWGREYNNRVSILSRQGIIGNLPPTEGQEAAQLISQYALQEGDWLLPTYRDVPPLIRHGIETRQAMNWYNGHTDGFAYDHSIKAFPPQVIIGAQIIQAAGVGLGLKKNKKENVAMTYIGDGGTSQGDFYEGLNFAGVYDAPVIFIAQNNGFGISVPRSFQTKSATLSQKGIGVGIAHLFVDGMDPFAVYAATKAAREYAVAGNGPVLLEFLTFRYGPHTLSDDPRRYRENELVDSWLPKDQLIRMRKFLTEKGLWSEEQEAAIIEKTQIEVKDALDASRKLPKQKISEYLANMYEVMPPSIKEQYDLYVEKENA
ncbi:thiamine pyrophosphate-dependent dehydrogenase E1 component subunit alpha [Erysipelothrix rhusiopathiae]|uniref:2-oxoisovalerate dehydrogenase subunit alpha n=2 Tax=Erysipelothrix TaxID=1647 RepID=E7FVE2_ERYRH|nr:MULTISPECIES: thiamine pyrophosphate-dependent dehydrogenase E1 component subunit alpha [Erysipelothrix]UPU38753.1 thiamine pyrophosphate-dependent dehydrogenase E1 component subunit alpha [Erysipelothrix sp. Poltava]CAH2763613.1 pyruvate dehydrogenase (acetyl-transferring) E1 component subunit alpha [Erysipelothrix sp. A18Y020d]AMS10554.1 pyruvate dehydrogenase (acetyl-transferring) E1 component subunit alpha [Erysipelothrix rhusiopathiae]AOO67105.1 pyruvate dehydrogenase (acetyl-transferri